MRLFVAINLSSEIERYLENVSRGFNVARMNSVKSFHFTLIFLGEVADEKISEIKEKLGQIKFKKFKMRLGPTGFFSDRSGHIRIIWVGLAAPEILNQLQKDVEIKMGRFFSRTVPEAEKFTPHVTLARVKFANDKDLAAQIKSAKIEKMEMEIAHFSLMKSELTSTGPVYTELAVYGADSP